MVVNLFHTRNMYSLVRRIWQFQRVLTGLVVSSSLLTTFPFVAENNMMKKGMKYITIYLCGWLTSLYYYKRGVGSCAILCMLTGWAGSHSLVVRTPPGPHPQPPQVVRIHYISVAKFDVHISFCLSLSHSVTILPCWSWKPAYHLWVSTAWRLSRKE